MKSQTVCFTGHREISPAIRSQVYTELAHTVGKLYLEGYRDFCTGGALGFDTMAAQVVLMLRKKRPDVRLRLIIPCPQQAARWQTSDVEMYEAIKQAADEVIFTQPAYTRGCMHSRNRRLVEESSVCVCFLQKETGGTAYTVSYAEKNGLRILPIQLPTPETDIPYSTDYLTAP